MPVRPGLPARQCQALRYIERSLVIRKKAIFVSLYCGLLLIFEALNLYFHIYHLRVNGETARDFFDILCTSSKSRMTTGSYKIRCEDFKKITEHCGETARVFLLSHEEVLEGRSHPPRADKFFNATITVKQKLQPDPRFGVIFLDVVDKYLLGDEIFDVDVEYIVQNEDHGQDKFFGEKFHVIEHWYNSFPADMLSNSTVPVFDLPQIKSGASIRMATVWNNKKETCPTMPVSANIKYDCIMEHYSIEKWYRNHFGFASANHTEMKRLEDLLSDPMQGPGRIYFELFWQYDILVVPSKISSPQKLKYGNVQRAVSQMRSGVPVLLEIYGKVLHDFHRKYNYSCVFKVDRASGTQENLVGISTFEEALSLMKSPVLRKQCQEEGLRISADYSPTTIVSRELRMLGYHGRISCH